MREVFAPIALFAFNRPLHLGDTVASLLRNAEASQTDLTVFSDGPRSPVDGELVAEVRRFAASIQGFKSVRLVSRAENWGLAKSVIAGVSALMQEYGRAIVIEDDLTVSPMFLRFINEALDKYEHDERVASISGYTYPIDGLPASFFIRGADCWGWGAWKRSWDLFNPNSSELLRELKARRAFWQFDFHGTYAYKKMLEDHVRGRNKSWAIRWYASTFLHDKLTLYPGRSLVSNHGHDGSGTHCAANASYKVPVLATELPTSYPAVVEHSEVGAKLFEVFFKSQYSMKRRLFVQIKNILTAPWHHFASQVYKTAT